MEEKQANGEQKEERSNADNPLKPGHRGLVRIVKAAGYSWQGITACYKNEAAFRQELLLLVILTPVAMWLSYNAVEFILLIGSVVLLLVVELLNTAVEMVVDRHGEEWHELSKLAKDMGSAAVFVMMGLVILVWVTLIISHLNWQLF
ncbi:MAG: diacylglycerol kinase [Pseudomonadota bacterium]|nr:diacylglycerol kinase [Pseudomonadota bacterium]